MNQRDTLRIAAVADIHVKKSSAGAYQPLFAKATESADVLLLAGDLTRHGDPAEAKVLAEELDGLPVPVVAVLGNHDFHADREEELTRVLERAGVRVLEGESTVVEADGVRIGIAGTKGFGGGFPGACGSDFGEPEMKAFVRHTKSAAERLERAMQDLDGDARVVLLHYSPVADTLEGERLEIYPFLGSYILGDAIDRVGADLILHGHAHVGTEKGVTPGGILVRNVAQPVIKNAYTVYRLRDAGQLAPEPAIAH